jgi:alkylation response protein AidB-like acyl-CoA dehydrogenase
VNAISYTPNLRDIEFVLFEQLSLSELLGKPPYQHVARDDLRMVLEYGASFASDVIAPSNAEGDRTGCVWQAGRVTVPRVFEPVWAALQEQGWMGLVGAPEFGGQGLPRMIGTAIDEMFIAANPAFHTYFALGRAAANLLIHHGRDEDRRIFAPKILSGEWQGTMCLTEAGAGSDVGASTTRALPAGDGSYLISGTKVFITAGEHQMTANHVHLVLARLPDSPPGVKGLSLFLVPKLRVNASGEITEPNDVYCSKIESKMGIHGSATTVLNFGDNGRCQGFLVGEANQGIRCMFEMMNEARIIVGLQGQALAAAMYANAVKFAQERIQGSDIAQGKRITQAKVPIIRHPDVRRMLMTVRALAEGGRALLYYTSAQVDRALAARDPEVRARHEALVGLLTPICKAWASEAGVEACSQALQVYGGSGFVSDYPAEQYLRDSRISPIYEGTNGIQAIDLLFRKVLGNPAHMQEFSRQFSDWMQTRGRSRTLAPEIEILAASERRLQQATDALAERARQDAEMAALGAYPYLIMFGNLAVAWLLLDQAAIADANLAGELGAEDRRFFESKIAVARFFAHHILSQNHWRAAQVGAEDRSALDICL